MTLIRTCEVRAVRQCGEVTGFYRACDRCRNEVLRWLGSIERDFQALDTAPKSSPFGGGARGAFGSKSPASDHVITMLDRRSSPAKRMDHEDDRENAPLSVPAVVGSWCEVAWRNSEQPFPGTVGEGFWFLRIQTDWLMQQGCAAEYAGEIRDLYIQLRGHSEPLRKIGECPTEIMPGIACQAPLRVGVEDDVIRCRGCGTVWERPWHDLRAALGGGTVMDYAMLSGWLGVKVGTLWRWCAEDGWVRQNTEKRALWLVVDVLGSYQKRRDKLTKEAS